MVHHRGSRASAVDQDEAETPGGVSDGETGQGVGSGTFTQTDHILNVQVVQNCHQVLTQGGHGREIETAKTMEQPVKMGKGVQLIQSYSPCTLQSLIYCANLQRTGFSRKNNNYFCFAFMINFL